MYKTYFLSTIWLILTIMSFAYADGILALKSIIKGRSLQIGQLGTIDTNGNQLRIGSGGITIHGTLNSGSSEIHCEGDWTLDSEGTFTASTSTVVLDGADQTISGNNTFYSLNKTASTECVLYFDYESTQTITGSLSLQGTDGNLLSLRSTQDGDVFEIVYTGEENRLTLYYLDLKDLYADGGKPLTALHSINSGNSSNLVFSDADIICAAIKVLLEGAYDFENHNMKTTLRENSLIPEQSPYDTDPIIVSNIPSDVTDWVLVELRESATGAVVMSKSMFLKSDGSIVDTTGNPPEFPNLNAGDYFVIVRHRNHLDIMSKNAEVFVAKGETPTTIDLSNIVNVYGTNGLKELETNVWGMYAGDASQDGKISSNDYDVWYNDRIENKSGYLGSDMNLSGTISSDDYDKWYNTRIANASSQVPEEEE